jgi:uncharacterized protein YjbI with pentapeptide repeats
MAISKHLAKLKKGVKVWNQWRKENPDARVDLNLADLSMKDLTKVNLRGADCTEIDLRATILRHADLSGANLSRGSLGDADLSGSDISGDANLLRTNFVSARLDDANLRGANLRGAVLRHASLYATNLSGADLRGADLSYADLIWTDLRGAKLMGANLSGARLFETCLETANLTGSSVYGVSVWDAKLEGAIQSDLVIERIKQPSIHVDNLEVAQFLYLLLNNARIRNVIDTITFKLGLILGRFTPQRKAVLDAIRDELRKRDYLPVVFDFEKPDSKDLTGTVATLAHMARFIIADLTDPSSVPHELASIVPATPVALQTIIVKGQREYAMFADLKKRYRWVLSPYRYDGQETLLANLDAKIIGPAEAKARALAPKTRQQS